jgi:5'-3' exonuclease
MASSAPPVEGYPEAVIKRLHLVDGTFELFRGHFSNRPPHPKKAVVALCAQLLWLLSDSAETVTHIAIAFDNPIRSFRNDLFPGYKTEEGVDPVLLAQFDLAEETARAIGLTVWSMDRWEADDALASGATRFADEVEQVRIMTPDKDLGQALRGTRVVQVDRMRKKEVDEARLLELRGILPGSIPDWLALVGDTSDGIPGIPGFGEKTASALLKAYGRLEAIPRDARRWEVPVRGADRLCEALFGRWDDALLYRKLATLVTDVPLLESLADLEWKGVPRDAFEAWRGRVGASDLGARVPRWA